MVNHRQSPTFQTLILPGKIISLHNNRVMVLAWRDKKIVKMITSLHQDEMQTAEVWRKGHNERLYRVPVQ